jgi:hypothetical protein
MICYQILIIFIFVFKPLFCQNQYDDSELAYINREMLNCQNSYRRMHNAPDLLINPELVTKAQDEAVRLSRIGRLEFSSVYLNGAKVGEILWGKSLKSGNIGMF